MDEETPKVMSEADIRAIIQDELSKSLNMKPLIDRTVSEKHLQILDARNIQLGKTTGTKIGTEVTQKLAFYGVTPTIQQATIAAPSGGSTVDSQARTVINIIITTLKNIGITN